MRILVTGGLGVIGSRFTELATERGHTVTIVDAAEEKRNRVMAGKLKAEILTARIETLDFGPLLARHDAVLHAAAHTGIPHSATDPLDWRSNVDGHTGFLEALRLSETKPPTVMLSSVKPYAVHTIDPRLVRQFGVDESCPLLPDEPYAASKAAQTMLVAAYAATYDLPVMALRCSNLYGDAPCHGPRHGWLTWFCIAAALDVPIELQGTGEQTRDMLFSDDVASAVFLALDKIQLTRGLVCNLGGGPRNTVSCNQALEMIGKVLGRPLKITKGPGRKSEDQIFVSDHRKFTNLTGWVPIIGVEEGIERIVTWALENADELRRMYDL